MHIIRQKLKSIDNNAVVSKYSVIYGKYYDCGNVMYIKNILGGSNRTAVVEYRMQLDSTIAHPTSSFLSVWEYIRPVELAGIINRMKMIWVK